MQRWRCWLPLISLGAFRHSRNRGQNTLIGLQISGLRVPLINVIICFIIFLMNCYNSMLTIYQIFATSYGHKVHQPGLQVISHSLRSLHIAQHLHMAFPPLHLLLISSSFSKTPKANNSGPLAGYCSLPLQPPHKFPSNHVHCSYYMHLSRF